MKRESRRAGPRAGGATHQPSGSPPVRMRLPRAPAHYLLGAPTPRVARLGTHCASRHRDGATPDTVAGSTSTPLLRRTCAERAGGASWRTEHERPTLSIVLCARNQDLGAANLFRGRNYALPCCGPHGAGSSADEGPAGGCTGRRANRRPSAQKKQLAAGRRRAVDQAEHTATTTAIAHRPDVSRG